MKAFHEVRNYGSDFMVWTQNYQNISFLAHWHKEIEFIYVRSGSAHISVEDQSFTANTGDLVICDSGSIHYSDSFSNENSLDFLIFDPNIISPFYLRSNFAFPLVTAKELENYHLDVLLMQLFQKTNLELKTREPYYQEIITSLLKEFWYNCKRRLPIMEEASDASTRRTSMLHDLQQLLLYLEDHHEENITLKFAAAKMNLSECYFSKVFKKLTGMNFVTYLNVIRVEKAAKQLKTTSTKITDIAFNNGFHNIRTFNRVFKELTGVTPSAFVLDPNPDDFSLKVYRRKAANYEIVDTDSTTVISNRHSI